MVCRSSAAISSNLKARREINRTWRSPDSSLPREVMIPVSFPVPSLMVSVINIWHVSVVLLIFYVASWAIQGHLMDEEQLPATLWWSFKVVIRAVQGWITDTVYPYGYFARGSE
jgi:hypothetical protein